MSQGVWPRRIMTLADGGPAWRWVIRCGQLPPSIACQRVTRSTHAPRGDATVPAAQKRRETRIGMARSCAWVGTQLLDSLTLPMHSGSTGSRHDRVFVAAKPD